jgi:hypothetical protein
LTIAIKNVATLHIPYRNDSVGHRVIKSLTSFRKKEKGKARKVESVPIAVVIFDVVKMITFGQAFSLSI